MVNPILLEALNEAFKPLGFRKKSASWYRVTGNLYCVVSAQVSGWDESCYVNIGFAPAAKVETGWLPESKCLVRFRVDAITSISREGLDLLAEEGISKHNDSDLHAELVEKIATPVAELVNSIENTQDLKSLLRTEISEQVFIHREMIDELLAEG
ncbi:DUF4304 domain-containing protein [Streptomyces sp. NPDC026665]|uniref:DUF4304 domain-containing protein n=1 Tax=Streptomyces sp. NPDC026665 TaxID=3154798 RepID=UPI0033C69549